MKTLFLCGKWPVPVEYNTVEEIIEVGGSRNVQHEKRMNHLSHNAWALHLLLEKLDGIKKVTDYCAGIGLWASVLLHELELKELKLIDLDEACVCYLSRIYKDRPEVRAICTDYFTAAEEGGEDLACLDLTIATAVRTLGASPTLPLQKILGHSPKAVILSDCAAPKLHLNREAYAVVLGESPETYDQYLQMYSEQLHSSFGFCVSHLVKCGTKKRPHSAYLLLQPREEVRAVKEIPMGTPSATDFGPKGFGL